jgi:flagellar basal-body rod modification protein FlgD
MITQRTNMTGRINSTPEFTNKGETINQDAAADQKKLGGKDIGTVLNELADPNWVDPAKTRKVGNNQLDKDAFLKLMMTQMKSQDPTNPLESHEMAAQLAQFTSLEQLQNLNTKMDKLVDVSAPNDKFQALSMIGKVVSSDSSYLNHANGMKEHEVKFKLQDDSSEVSVVIRDQDGKDIKTYNFANLKKGDNSVRWNARTEDGYEVRPGEFRVFFVAKDANGKSVKADTEVSGKITGVNFTAAGPVLLVGNQSLKLSDVKQLQDESVLQDQSKKVMDITNLDLQNGDNKQDTKGVQPKGNLDQVAMQKSFKDSVEGKKK